MKGKIIYEPKGKALEYAKYAANFYVGCTGRCHYCYNRQGITAKVLGGDYPELKKSLDSPLDALIAFECDLKKNLPEYQKHGIFFNFVSDPCLPETWELNSSAMYSCWKYNVPVKLLTKQTWWVDEFLSAAKTGVILSWSIKDVQRLTAIGFTLTGHDELEPGCASNAERISAMGKLYHAGIKIWASIEPVINLKDSFTMIDETKYVCSLYKIGLQSGTKYNADELRNFIAFVNHILKWREGVKIYWKDSLLKQAGIDRKELPTHCVDRDYNIFRIRS